MAALDQRRPENVPGDFYVDATCIDCDTCRWMAPATFTRTGEQSSVHVQPASEVERDAALLALVSCPTASIGTVERHSVAEVARRLPLPIDGGVHHCGYHAEASFGAASYLVVRDSGNVLVDSPRFSRPLVRRLEELGGVRWMFLTHVDDVADHERFAAHFGCERVLHADDARGPLGSIERKIEGTRPVALEDDLTLIPVPGHTRGSTCLLYRNTYLFSGDHVAWSQRLERVYAFRSACWYDWDVQTESMERLVGFDFEWILPGHGRRCHFSRERMREEVRGAAAWMRTRR